MDGTAIVAVLVGICWGLTNTVVRAGVLQASTRTAKTPLQAGLARCVGQHWAGLLVTPTFIVPQALNWAASTVLVLSLAGSRLHVATPVANAVCIAVTAASARLLMKDRLHPVLLVLGAVCVAAGVALTTT